MKPANDNPQPFDSYLRHAPRDLAQALRDYAKRAGQVPGRAALVMRLNAYAMARGV